MKYLFYEDFFQHKKFCFFKSSKKYRSFFYLQKKEPKKAKQIFENEFSRFAFIRKVLYFSIFAVVLSLYP